MRIEVSDVSSAPGQLDDPAAGMHVDDARTRYGLAWMWRIYKAPTKYEDLARWRYRERD